MRDPLRSWRVILGLQNKAQRYAGMDVDWSKVGEVGSADQKVALMDLLGAAP